MKLSTSLALVAAAAASPATLFTESSNSALNGKGLSNLHEGAGLNGVYLSDSPVPYEYNETSHAIYTPAGAGGQYPFYMSVEDSTLIVGVAGTLVYPTNGYITVNGSADLFYACKPGVPYDPYHYSERSYGVAVFESGDEIPATCESIKIRADV